MSPINSIKWGCVADDFTGAADMASFLTDVGVRTVLICKSSLKNEILTEDAQALVVALKTRSIQAGQARQQCLETFKWLEEQGCTKFYYKYCSTFDSTDQGNIGPVIDEVLETWDLPFTILCPSLLINGRTVKDGILYVHGIPLSETNMRNHPLTPMRHSYLKELMKHQGKYPCINLNWKLLESGNEEIRRFVERCKNSYPHFYLAADCFKEEHNHILSRAFGGERFLTGSSGLAPALAEYYWGKGCREEIRDFAIDDMPRLLLSGSCSEMVGKQIRRYQSQGGCTIELDTKKILMGELTDGDIWNMVKSKGKQDVLVYSWSRAEDIRRLQDDFGTKNVSQTLEYIIGNLACRAFADGYRRIIVAGGETSGAVTRALDISSFRVLGSIDPGVPLLIPRDKGKESLRLVLKSGNFGSEDFFIKALREEGK